MYEDIKIYEPGRKEANLEMKALPIICEVAKD